VTDTYTLLGEASLGACVPIAAEAQVAGMVAVGISLPDLTARLDGMVGAQVGLTLHPPSIQAQLDLALQLVANLQAMLTMPSASVSLGIVSGLIAELQVTLGSLQVQASLLASIGVTLGTPGVWAVHYAGTDEGLIPGGLPGVSAPVEAVIIAGADAGAIAAIRSALRVT
jgi:hypothetical protein